MNNDDKLKEINEASENIDDKIEEIKQNSEKLDKTEKINPFSKVYNLFKRIPYKPIIILAILLLIVVFFPSKLPDIFSFFIYAKIEKISNLATVEAYYHNVASKEVEATTIGKIFGNIGYKKYWIEYDGTVQFGIDAKKVRIEKPTIKNVVKIYIPESSILGKPVIVENSVSDPITDTGFLTTIDAYDKTEAIAEAQKKLEETASKDNELLTLAKERAKMFFKKYIESIGKEIGKDYKVEFLDK